MKKLNEEHNPELQGTNFLTGERQPLEKGGGGSTASAQARLNQQRRTIQKARTIGRRERIKARKTLQQTNREMMQQAGENRKLLDNIIGGNVGEVEFIDDREDSLSSVFGLAATRRKTFGLGSSKGRQQLG